MFGSNDAQKNLIDVTVNGTINGMLFVLGNLRHAENEINIVVNGTVDASEVTGTDEAVHTGIAICGNAAVTVNNGAVVKGESGIEVRAGSLTVNGGTITATAESYSYAANGSGTTTKGAAVAVAQHNTVLATNVTLNGGTLQGVEQIAVTDVNDNDLEGVTVLAMEGYTQNSTIPEDFEWVESGTAGKYTLQKVAFVGNLKLSASLTLNDNINVNVFARELAEGTTPEDYSIVATFRGQTKTYPLSEATVVTDKGVTKYKVTVAEVFSYEMGLPVTITVMYLDTELVSFDYSVRDYFTNGIESSTMSESYKKIFRAGLDYGAAAQLYFDGKTYNNGTYDTDTAHLVNSEYNASDISVEAPTGYAASISGQVPSGLSKLSASLILGSEVSIKVYFKYSGNVSDLTFTAYRQDNDSLTKTVTAPVPEDSGRYSVKITGIKSYELGKYFTLSISDGSSTFCLNYSPYVYIQSNWNNSDAELADLCHALKKYGDLAKELWPNG